MFDLNELKTYKEGNRLEVKKALGRDEQGELPRSVWETVSAFANTSEGVIVLGVTERKEDGGFVVHGIPRAGKVLDDFWNAALSEDKLSARFMRDSDATVETVEGRDIVVIRVPWVDRYTRPVYIDNNLFGGTFRRTHTGNHRASARRCSRCCATRTRPARTRPSRRTGGSSSSTTRRCAGTACALTSATKTTCGAAQTTTPSSPT